MNPRNELLNTLDEAMGHIALGRSESAMIPLWRIHMALRELDIREPERAPKLTKADFRTIEEFSATWREAKASTALDGDTQHLPPMKPIRNKKMVSLDVKCPVCGSPAGQKCYAMTRRGSGADPVPGTSVEHTHRARIAKARS